MTGLLERLEAGERLVGDGAWGTLLMERGLGAGEPPEAMNLTHPQTIEEIAQLYLQAGADLITTNTFGASPARLRAHGLEERLEEITHAAVAAVRRAVGRGVLVSGSVGPTGLVLRPYGDADPAEMGAGFERQIAALAEAGADLVCIETMTDLNEAILAVRAVRAVAPGLPVMATMTFERTRRGFFTVMGASVEQSALGLVEAGADVVGSNCGNGSEVMVEIARAFRGCTDRPVAIQPNAGLPELHGTAVIYPERPVEMAERARVLFEMGVGIVGGCCGTTPEHVRALREVAG